ncbi:MAG: hypothetical protein K1X38_02645, partial [Microthrixaceae bacterium]|nr:hypothetical protein [Microthrixaceae bacterium]
MTDTAAPTTATTEAPSFTELVDGVRATFDSGRTRPMQWRRRQLEGLLRLLGERESDLVDAVVADLGRPAIEAFGTEVGHVRLQVRHVLKHFESWAKPT